MSKRLYRVRFEFEVYGLADSAEDAEIDASEWLEQDVRDNASAIAEDAEVSEVRAGDHVPPEWLDSLPQGEDDEFGDRTVREILDALKAEAEAAKLAGPAPGQADLPLGED